MANTYSLPAKLILNISFTCYLKIDQTSSLANDEEIDAVNERASISCPALDDMSREELIERVGFLEKQLHQVRNDNSELALSVVALSAKLCKLESLNEHLESENRVLKDKRLKSMKTIEKLSLRLNKLELKVVDTEARLSNAKYEVSNLAELNATLLKTSSRRTSQTSQIDKRQQQE